ncbi:MAG: tetratricopeptide repeat protein [Desulfuromusa sp.]|nr:tetratricopeptide repeat protein [Desulfuromusa sp.]
MRHPIQIVKIVGFLLFLLLFFMSVTMTVQAAEPITLLDIQKQKTTSYTRIIFTFSALPKFIVEDSGQRVDLLLSNVQLSPELHTLPEDEKVVKVLLEEQGQELLVSVLLRRLPKQVITETQQSPARLIMDVYWDAGEGVRPAVAFNISDMPPRKAGRRAARLQLESPWTDRWDKFFRDYRTYWKLELPVNFTLPQLPALIMDEQSPLWALQQHADNHMLLSLIQTASGLSHLNPQQRYLRDLLLAEAQLRTDAIEAGIARLDVLRRQEGAEQARVEYLTAYGQALEGQPLVAQLTLQQLLPELSEDHPLLPLTHFLFAETALASGQDRVALEHLQRTDLNWPDSLLVPLEMRIADAQAGLGELGEALVVYQDLVEEPGLFDYYRFSLNRAAFSAFKSKNYELASSLYRKFVERLNEEPGDDLLLFAAGSSAYEAGDMGWGMIGLQRAVLDRHNTEGGDRAELRLIDHKLISGGELWLAQMVTEYASLGVSSQFRSVREESQFKQALALYLLGEHRKSVDELMRFRREFGSAELIREVNQLILEQLPKVVRQLIEEKNDLQAVVLAEQNRELLLRSGFNKEFLRDLATAFDRLGLYERAGRVLLYLFDRTAGNPQQQFIYLPIAQSYLKRKEYQQAGEYASRYLEEFPRGEDGGALFGILLDAFEREELQDELISWLNRENRPSSPELEIRAAYIYWQMGELQAVIKSLESVYLVGASLQVKEMALLGEAYYQLEKNGAAEKKYRQLYEDPDFGAQARYRTAQILLRQEQRQAALKLLQQIVETDGDSSWGKLAQDLLIQEKR